jgi:hypothetical protein
MLCDELGPVTSAGPAVFVAVVVWGGQVGGAQKAASFLLGYSSQGSRLVVRSQLLAVGPNEKQHREREGNHGTTQINIGELLCVACRTGPFIS